MARHRFVMIQLEGFVRDCLDRCVVMEFNDVMYCCAINNSLMIHIMTIRSICLLLVICLVLFCFSNVQMVPKTIQFDNLFQGTVHWFCSFHFQFSLIVVSVTNVISITHTHKHYSNFFFFFRNQT